MEKLLQNIFRKEAKNSGTRAKFLSRMLGIFSEEIVSIWARDERATYRNLGRPTLRDTSGERGHTLDFALQCRETNRLFVAEMKCEIEYQNFRYFVLENRAQLSHHEKKPAFQKFLRCATPSDNQPLVYIAGETHDIDGAILVWGAVTDHGRKDVCTQAGISDVLSLEDICADLASWESQEFFDLLGSRLAWCAELVHGLSAKPVPHS